MDQATARARRKLWIIILAAGASTRLGTPKQLLRQRGKTLLSRTIALATAVAGPRVSVVIGAGQHRIRAHLRKATRSVRVTYNRDWTGGMGTSLAAGIRALPPDADSILVLLCDQPKLDARSLDRLIHRARTSRAAIVTSRYAGRQGVPAILPRATFRELRSLTGDRGARDLLNSACGRFQVIAVDMPEAAFDIDTPADAAALRS
jgi:molybdenum cofactor cytidylyltransferase